MDIRICFRVRERKDVDLVLGQGMLTAGWHANSLNAPGKFLVSAPEHTTPKRARAYLITDQAVKDTAARYASSRPTLDEISLRATAGTSSRKPDDNAPAENADHRHAAGAELDPAEMTTDADALWLALSIAPDEGSGIGHLMRETGMSRPTLYRHLRQHAEAGRAIQVSRGRWRARSATESS